MITEMQPEPYRTTPVFDQDSLPQALRHAHSTKAGVWGIIRVHLGALRFVTAEPMDEQILAPGRPGLIHPRQLHFVEPIGAMRMQVEFYDSQPVT